MAGVAGFCRRVTSSRLFEVLIVVVIGANAVVLGLETYPHLRSPVLHDLELFFRLVFVVEIAMRILAHGNRPQDFFRSGWNVFDFVVTAAISSPGCTATRPSCGSSGSPG